MALSTTAAEADPTPSLTVTVAVARKATPGGLLFVQLNLGDRILRTRPSRVNDNGSAAFNETLCFYEALADIYGRALEIQLMQLLSPNAEPSVVGRVRIPVQRLPVNRHTDVDLTLNMRQPAPDQEPAQLDLSFLLAGRVRRPLRGLLEYAEAYTHAVDRGLEIAAEQSERAVPYVKSKWGGVAKTLPLTIAAVATVPVLIVFGAIFAPVALPLLVVLLAVLATLGAVVAASSSAGRAKVGELLRPVVSRLSDTGPGQELLYETGPLPDVGRVAGLFVPEDKWHKLAASLAIDIIGSSSYLLPVIGEAGDLGWAPLQALLIAGMYSKSSPYAAYVGFTEELLPFTDIIPTATLAWLKEFGPEIYYHYREIYLGRAAAGGGPEDHID